MLAAAGPFGPAAADVVEASEVSGSSMFSSPAVQGLSPDLATMPLGASGDLAANGDLPSQSENVDDGLTDTVLRSTADAVGVDSHQVFDVASMAMQQPVNPAAIGNLLGDVSSWRLAAMNGSAVSDLSVVDATSDQFLGAQQHFGATLAGDRLAAFERNANGAIGAPSDCHVQIGELDFGTVDRSQARGPLIGTATISVTCPDGQAYRIANLTGPKITLPHINGELHLFKDEKRKFPFAEGGLAIRSEGSVSADGVTRTRRHTVYAVLSHSQNPDSPPLAGAIKTAIRLQVSN